MGDCVAGVDNVLDYDYVASGHVFLQTYHFFDCTCGTHACIAFQADKGNLCVNAFRCTEQVAGKRKRPVQYTYEQGRFFRVIAHYFFTQLLNAGVNGFSGDVGHEGMALVCHFFHP